MINDLLVYAGVILIVLVISIPGWISLIRAQGEDIEIVPITPEAYRTMESTLVDLSRRLSEMESLRHNDHQRMAAQQEEMLALQSEIDRIWSRFERWMAYAQKLANIMRDNKIEVPPSPEEVDTLDRARPVKASELSRLRTMIAVKFSPEEIRSLAFDMGILSSIKGETATELAESLVGTTRAHDRIGELIVLCRDQRPNAGF